VFIAVRKVYNIYLVMAYYFDMVEVDGGLDVFRDGEVGFYVGGTSNRKNHIPVVFETEEKAAEGLKGYLEHMTNEILQGDTESAYYVCSVEDYLSEATMCKLSGRSYYHQMVRLLNEIGDHVSYDKTRHNVYNNN